MPRADGQQGADEGVDTLIGGGEGVGGGQGGGGIGAGEGDGAGVGGGDITADIAGGEGKGLWETGDDRGGKAGEGESGGGAGVLVRLNVVGTPPPAAVALTVYDPALVLAVKAGAMATPLLSVVTVAPVSGATKLTATPGTGLG